MVQDAVKSRVQGDGWGGGQRYFGPLHCAKVGTRPGLAPAISVIYQETVAEGGLGILYRGFGMKVHRK